jgi:hypothetical protein
MIALAESEMGLFKTERHRNPAVLADYGGHWKGLDDLEIATCAWVSWFNEARLHGELGDTTPSEFKTDYRVSDQATVALREPSSEVFRKQADPESLPILVEAIRSLSSSRHEGLNRVK